MARQSDAIWRGREGRCADDDPANRPIVRGEAAAAAIWSVCVAAKTRSLTLRRNARRTRELAARPALAPWPFRQTALPLTRAPDPGSSVSMRRDSFGRAGARGGTSAGMLAKAKPTQSKRAH